MKKIINTLSDTIEVTEKKSQYDQYAKRLLSNKFVLANILAECADEFRGMPVEEVVTCIDGDPEVSLGTKMQYGNPYRLEGYDLMEGIMICLPENGESKNRLISLLYTLFTNKLSSKDKKERLEKEFGIRFTKEEEEVMESTNGLASYVWKKAQREGFSSGEKQGLQQGIEQGLQQGIRLGVSQKNHEIIMRMHQKGLDDETIAMYLDLSAEEVRSIIQKG